MTERAGESSDVKHLVGASATAWILTAAYALVKSLNAGYLFFSREIEEAFCKPCGCCGTLLGRLESFCILAWD